MKRTLLLVAAALAMNATTSGPVQAQYYGANGSTWNNPMSASADIIIQQNMNRRMLRNSLRKRRAASKSRATRRHKGRASKTRYGTR